MSLAETHLVFNWNVEIFWLTKPGLCVISSPSPIMNITRSDSANDMFVRDSGESALKIPWFQKTRIGWMKWTVHSSIWLVYLIPASLHWTDKVFSFIWLTNQRELWDRQTEWQSEWPRQRPGQFVETNMSIYTSIQSVVRRIRRWLYLIALIQSRSHCWFSRLISDLRLIRTERKGCGLIT